MNKLWAVILIGVLLFAKHGRAQTWFSPVPNTLVNSPTIDTAAHTKVNQNFAALVANGNAGQATLLGMLSGLGPVGVPSHAVVMCLAGYGLCATGACPTNYQTADGTNGTADARGVYIRGLDTGGAIDPGRTLASYQADQLQDHSHASPNILASLFNFSTHASYDIVNASPVQNTGTLATPGTSGMTSGSVGSETRPLSAVVLFCERL